MTGIPEPLKARVAEIGRVVDPPSTAELYAPLHGPPPANVRIARDLSYGPDGPASLLDVFAPEGAEGLPVLLFIPGGPGNRIEPVPHGEPFYDNIVLWAAKHGMVGVNMQRRPLFFPWDVGGRDVAAAIQWIKAEVGRFGGDPERIVAWGHSMGAVSLATYLSHPELYGAGGHGLRGAVLMAGPYNVAPHRLSSPPPQFRLQPGGPVLGPEALFRDVPPPSGDPALPENGATLPGLKALDLPLFVNVAELDPEGMIESARILRDELKAAGRDVRYAEFADHGHLSEVFAVGTDDTSTSRPILDFILTLT